MYDYLVVGAGLFGSTFARMMHDKKRKCLIIDSRDHIGGNCYDYEDSEILVHKYGPHIFHTDSKQIWNFVNRFSKFNHYRHRKKVYYQGGIFSFPINLMTWYQLEGDHSPSAMQNVLLRRSIDSGISEPKNFEEWVISQIGKELYEMFYKGYTQKQWGREPRHLPADVAKRIPIRYNFNDEYFADRFQGLPIRGYTTMIREILNGIPVELNTPFKSKEFLEWRNLAHKIIFTGPIDEFFNFQFGELEYRTLDFKLETFEEEDHQGCACVNYTSEEEPYTRIVEYKHFYYCLPTQKKTILSIETPREWKRGDIPYYPINDLRNNLIHSQYKQMQSKEAPEVRFCGRLGDYRYLDMDDTIVAAMLAAEQEIKNGLAD